MKQLLWLGVFFLSASWLFFIPQFIHPDITMGVLCVVLGVLCMVAGLWNHPSTRFDKKYLFLLLPLALSLFVVPSPYHLGVIVLMIGLLVSALFYRREKTQVIPAGICLAGVILIIQTILIPLFTIGVSYGHRIDIFSPLLSGVGNLLGLHTSVSNGVVFVQTIQYVYPITTTWEKLGCFFWLNLFVGALLLFFLFCEKRKILVKSLIFLIASGGYIILRYIAILYGYLTTTELSIFWDPLVMTISFLPLALLLMKLIPFTDAQKKTDKTPSLSLSKKHFIAMILVFLLVFSVVGACVFQDPGSKKNGRVIIDEYHSDWEDSTKALDTEWYGLLSTYNYYSWAEWLSYYYHVEKNTNNTLTDELLDQYDILILKCPTEQYTEEEIRSIVKFVDDGGGLYLIGDHTDVFGMNTYLNQVAHRFGFRFNTDATYEIGTGNLSIFHPDLLFPHPIVQHLTQFDFMTSCTIEPTALLSALAMEPVIIGNRIISEPGTHATENFFRESAASTESAYGFLLQAAAIKYGDGRVVAFTDSTVFSSFCVFTDGYPSFTLGVMDYLNRTNEYSFLHLLFICIAILSCVAVLFLLRNTKKITILFIVFCAGMLSFSIAAPLFSSLNQRNYSTPAAITDFAHICFEQEHSSGTISLTPTVMYTDTNNYGTFYVWTQRVGSVPSLEKTLRGAVENGDIIVFINPVQPFGDTDLTLLEMYMERGGTILLMESITNSKSTANELTSHFGLWINQQTMTHPMYRNESNTLSVVGNVTTPYLSLTGGNPILMNEHNETQVSRVEFYNETNGRTGALVVMVDSSSFSDAVMGGPFTEPDEHQKQIYATEFFLFQDVLSPTDR